MNQESSACRRGKPGGMVGRRWQRQVAECGAPAVFAQWPGLAQLKEKARKVSHAEVGQGAREGDKQTSPPRPLAKSHLGLSARLLSVGLGACVPGTGVWVARLEALAPFTLLFLASGTDPGPGRVSACEC